MAKDVGAAVCDAALKWESDPRVAEDPADTSPPEGSQIIDAGCHPRVDDDLALKNSQTTRASEHLLAAAKHIRATARIARDNKSCNVIAPPGARYVRG